MLTSALCRWVFWLVIVIRGGLFVRRGKCHLKMLLKEKMLHNLQFVTFIS